MLDTVDPQGLWWKTKTKFSSSKRASVISNDSIEEKINKDGVVVAFKALVRLLNFILFLLAVSFLTSHNSHAASVDVASDLNQVTNQTETKTVHQSTTTSVTSGVDQESKVLIQTNQLTGTASDTSVNNSPDAGMLYTNNSDLTVNTPAATSIALSVTESDSGAVPLNTKVPTSPVSKTYTRTVVHGISTHAGQSEVHVATSAPTNHIPTVPITPSDTNVLNSTGLVIPMALVKQLLHELPTIPVHGSYAMLSELIAILAIGVLGVVVASVLASWVRKGFAQVVSPRGQTAVSFNMILSYKTNERVTYGHNALFNTFGAAM